RVDVDFPGQLVLLPHVALGRVPHQVNRHARNEVRNPPHGDTDLGTVREPGVARDVQTVERHEPMRVSPVKEAANSFQPFHVPPPPFSHLCAVLLFCRFFSICMHAKTAASNRSIRCVGSIFSYLMASSTISIPRTFWTQYSNASECR